MSLKKGNVYTTVKGAADAPWLLVLPGVGCGGFVFAEAMPHLVRYFNVCLVNQPWVDGAVYPGLTKPADLTVDFLAQIVAEIFKEVGMETAHVLGHSMGGFVAQRLALEHPGFIRRLVLMSTSYGGLRTDIDTRHVLFEQLLPTKAGVAHMPGAHALAALMFPAPFHEENPEAFRNALAMFKGKFDREDVLGLHMMCGARFSSFGDVRGIMAPTLVVHGTADKVVRETSGRKLAEELPQARYWPVSGRGHLPFLEEPAVLGRVTDFLLGDDSVGMPVPQSPPPTAVELAADRMWRHSRAHLTSLPRLMAVLGSLKGN